VALLTKELDMNPEYTLLVFNLNIYLPAVLVIFAVPSTYSYYGVTKNHVKVTAEYIKISGINSIDRVEFLEENMRKV
jgi:hypothetical protein